MQVDHIFIPCKLTSTRIHRKNLQKLHGESLLERTIRRFRRWEPQAQIWVATESGEARAVGEAYGCNHYPLHSDDLEDKRNATNLFNEFLTQHPGTYCASVAVTSPFLFRSEWENGKQVADFMGFARSAHLNYYFGATKFANADTIPLSQDMGMEWELLGNFLISNDCCPILPQDEVDTGCFATVSRLSAYDINSELDLAECRMLATYFTLEALDHWSDK